MDGDTTARTVREVNPPSMARPGGHYSHAAVANGFVFVSGQLPITLEGVKLSDASFETQAQQVLSNVQLALEGAGSGVAHLVQVRVYLASLDDWPRFNEIYASWAGPAKPARAVVPTGPLHFGLRLEVEAVGVIATEEFRRLQGAQTGKALVDALQASPHRDIDLSLPSSKTAPVRDVKL